MLGEKLGKRIINMDYAAATPLAPEAFAAMRPFLDELYLNPSARYNAARGTREALDHATAKVAAALGAKPSEIIWTSGGTEGDNLAVQGVLRAAKTPGAHWVTTAIEHHAILAAVEPLARENRPATVVAPNTRGLVDPEAVVAAVTDDTVLVSVALANGEIGTIQPVADIARCLAAIRADRAARGITAPLYLHTDATAAATALDLNVARLGVDLMTISASKFYGPRGTGILYVRTGTAIEPLFYGGGQNRGRRAGTENVAGAVGLAAALGLAQNPAARAATSRRLAALRDDAARRLTAAISGATQNGDPRRCLPGTLNLTIPGVDGIGLVLYLERDAGILAATGAACSSGDLEPSHVLTAIGRTRAEAASSLRLTFGRDTTSEHVDVLVDALPRAVAHTVRLSRPERAVSHG